ncbi:MAG: SGNH/GDSL hydrolase family protein [Bacteroides sp.]|nr:SGNH/GDSL hydrolase family protein [Bacteroides sp.]
MKRICLLALLMQAFFFLSSAYAQQKISILGDSYSTYGGYVTPSTNLCWYNGTDGGDKSDKNDVKSVEETWWHRLAQEHGYQLDVNNSYSGSTVCCTGYRKNDYSDRAFITRILNLGNPDIILVFGGTNDSWAGVPIGEFQYADWTKKDLYRFRPAFAYLLDALIRLYPSATIYSITNSELSAEVTNSMDEICRHYQITNIRLHDIEKQWGHPSVKGMESICEQVWEALKR